MEKLDEAPGIQWEEKVEKPESMPRIPEEGARNNPEDNMTPHYQSNRSNVDKVEDEAHFEKPRALSMSASKQSLKIKKILTMGTGGDNQSHVSNPRRSRNNSVASVAQLQNLIQNTQPASRQESLQEAPIVM